MAILLVLLALASGRQAPERNDSPAATDRSTAVPAEVGPDLLYGRITDRDGAVYEGRLRWGGDQEAVWGDYFNGAKHGNPWTVHAPREQRSLGALGLKISLGERPIRVERPFMTRFGDIARIEADLLRVRVTLKSGTVFELDRLEANDLDDGVRVWDARHGVVKLGPRQIRDIQFVAIDGTASTHRLHGTVSTSQGFFVGFLQWDRRQRLGTDEIEGRSSEGELRLRFDTIRSIARYSGDSSRLTLLDGREIVLSGSDDVGRGNLGIYVDDRRYGRVLISWDAFERVDFNPGAPGPAYDDFPPGHPLRGSVTTRDGRRAAGRLVYDLDESETTETLDAPSAGVDYTIPFGLLASIVLPGHGEHARVTLHGGETLELERAGDLGGGNAGMLIFADDRLQPEYVPWAEVSRVDFDRPPADTRTAS